MCVRQGGDLQDPEIGGFQHRAFRADGQVRVHVRPAVRVFGEFAESFLLCRGIGCGFVRIEEPPGRSASYTFW